MGSDVISFARPMPEHGGRDAELAALLREHEEARAAERARFVFVRGAAGVGKSHLFSSLRRALTAQGVVVFEAESPRDVKRPFGLFVQLCDALLDHVRHSALSPERLAALAEGIRPLRAPEVNGRLVGRLELHDAVAELFLAAKDRCPVFLFPDLDAADRASLDLLKFLSAQVTSPESRSPSLWVVSLRDDGELPAVLAEMLARIPARTLPLTGLDLEGIRSFLAREDVLRRLLHSTGGNPEALGELLERNPGQPAELFLRRVAGLKAEERQVLQLLAVARDALSAQVLGAALEHLGESSGGLSSTLDALVRERFVSVRLVAGRAHYRIARDPDKASLLGALSQSDAEVFSRALGRGHLAQNELFAASQLLLRVDPRGEGCQAAVRAADELAARGAYEDASDLYQQAVPHLSGEERARVRRRLAEIDEANGQFGRAVRFLLAGRRDARPDRQAEAKLKCDVARLLMRLGRWSFARMLLLAAEAEPDVAPVARAQHAELKLATGDARAALQYAQACLAEPSADASVAIELRNVMGKALLLLGRYDEARAAFEANRQAAEPLGRADKAAQALLNIGVAAHKAGDREGALAAYQAASTQGRHWVQAKALANLGALYGESGDFELALDAFSRSVPLFSRFGGVRELAHHSSNLARIRLYLGDLQGAQELAEFGLARARESSDRYLEGHALLSLGAVWLDRGDARAAQRFFSDAADACGAASNEGFAALALALKARAHLLCSERAQASEALAQGVVERGVGLLPSARIEVELTRAELHLAMGDWHEAARAVARAKDQLVSHPDLEGPYRAYHLSGRLKTAAGDVDGAQADFNRAARLLEELVQRVPPARRQAFLQVKRRSDVLASAQAELRLPRAAAAAPAVRTTYGLVGQSPSLQRVVKQLEPVARSNATVLIRGESGTGKELLAEAIHQLSPRRSMPLVKVNCAAMVEELLLSELFGHEKGAFTGAVRERKGRFELADGGTLFLDEIGDISPKCQVALLRVLQEREFERVGGTKTMRVDVRVICATNRDLETAIAQGGFRQDLYYRLKGVMLELPSLRERMGDLPELSAHLLEKIARDRSEPAKRLSAEAFELLSRHDWPGNVRELENVLASASIFAEGALITPEAFEHLPELSGGVAARPRPIPAPAAQPAEPLAEVVALPRAPLDYYALAQQRGLSLKDLRREVEVQCIKKALEQANGNISEAARLLKMKRSRLSQIVNAEPELKGVARAG